MIVFITLAAVLVALVFALVLWRVADEIGLSAQWTSLEALQPGAGAFDPSMVAHLPEPARRYFEFSIRTGAPLTPVAVIKMGGLIGLGDKRKPGYQRMNAVQVLAPPHGFIWRVRAGSGAVRIAGSDGLHDVTSWTRFWLWSIIPIARAGSNNDHFRSAFGRLIAEAIFWSPASLLPSDRIIWSEVDPSTARVTVSAGKHSQSVDVMVDPDGRPKKVVMERWSNANPARQFQLQPFGGYLSEFREFEGYRLATHVDGGNWIDTNDYFPFYQARVADIIFPRSRQRTGTER